MINLKKGVVCINLVVHRKGCHHRSRVQGGGKRNRLLVTLCGLVSVRIYESFLGMSAGMAKCKLWACGRPVMWSRY